VLGVPGQPVARVLAAPQCYERPLAAAERAPLDRVAPCNVGIGPLDLRRQLRDLRRVLERL
jgi:hypothetical protein